jgi:hypothetical protein
MLAEALVGEGGAKRIIVRIDCVHGLLRQADRTPELSGVAGRGRGPQQKRDAVDSRHGCSIGHALPDFDRLGEMPKGLGGSRDGGGVGGRPDECGERAGQVVAGQAVVG